MLAVSADKTGLCGEPLMCPIVSMFDVNGDLTTKSADVFMAIVILPNNEHMVVHCSPRNIVDLKVH